MFLIQAHHYLYVCFEDDLEKKWLKRKNISDTFGQWQTIQADQFLSTIEFDWSFCSRVDNKANNYIILRGRQIIEFKIGFDG